MKSNIKQWELSNFKKEYEDAILCIHEHSDFMEWLTGEDGPLNNYTVPELWEMFEKFNKENEK